MMPPGDRIPSTGLSLSVAATRSTAPSAPCGIKNSDFHAVTFPDASRFARRSINVGRSFRVPSMFICSRPLHAHGPIDGFCQQCGVGRGVLVTIAAIAARAIHINAADIAKCHRKHLGELFAQIVGRLRCRPARQFAVREFCIAQEGPIDPCV